MNSFSRYLYLPTYNFKVVYKKHIKQKLIQIDKYLKNIQSIRKPLRFP